jgi:hypothetical protein
MLALIETFHSSAHMLIQIDYRLTGTGWAECNVSSGEQTCLLSASYLSDALRNLVLAANGVLAGFSKLTFSFDEEPGEFRWVITSPRLNEVQIEILEFHELWGGRPDTEGNSLYKSRCRPIVFAKAVEEAAKRVLETHGEGGYRKKWAEHPFPTAQYAELVRAIEQDGGD